MSIEHFGEACYLSRKEGFSSLEGTEGFLSFAGPGAALCSIVPPVHSLPRYLYTEIKWPGSDDGRSHTFSSVITNVWIHTYIPPYVVMAWDLVTVSLKLTFPVSLDTVRTVNISTERPAFVSLCFQDTKSHFQRNEITKSELPTLPYIKTSDCMAAFKCQRQSEVTPVGQSLN